MCRPGCGPRAAAGSRRPCRGPRAAAGSPAERPARHPAHRRPAPRRTRRPISRRTRRPTRWPTGEAMPSPVGAADPAHGRPSSANGRGRARCRARSAHLQSGSPGEPAQPRGAPNPGTSGRPGMPERGSTPPDGQAPSAPAGSPHSSGDGGRVGSTVRRDRPRRQRTGRPMRRRRWAALALSSQRMIRGPATCALEAVGGAAVDRAPDHDHWLRVVVRAVNACPAPGIAPLRTLGARSKRGARLATSRPEVPRTIAPCS